MHKNQPTLFRVLKIKTAVFFIGVFKKSRPTTTLLKRILSYKLKSLKQLKSAQRLSSSVLLTGGSTSVLRLVLATSECGELCRAAGGALNQLSNLTEAHFSPQLCVLSYYTVKEFILESTKLFFWGGWGAGFLGTSVGIFGVYSGGVEAFQPV